MAEVIASWDGANLTGKIRNPQKTTGTFHYTEILNDSNMNGYKRGFFGSVSVVHQQQWAEVHLFLRHFVTTDVCSLHITHPIYIYQYFLGILAFWDKIVTN